jgi:hypothetical protein
VKRAAAVAAACVAVLVAAPAASGQIVIFDIGGNARQVSSIQTNVRVTGTVSVDFRGDEAAGCAAARLCDTSGNVTWDPSGRAQLLAYGYRFGGHRFEGAFLTFGIDEDEGSHIETSARVRRSGGGLCADGVAPSFDAVGSRDRPGTSVEIALAGASGSPFPASDHFRTRCAGPTADDLRALLPTHLVSERALRRGHARLDFSGERSFSAGGLTGTLHSTVVLHLGRTTDRQGDGSSDTEPTHRIRRRAIEVSYRIERVSGRVVTHLHGLADPDLCGPLDACGLMGTVTTAPRDTGGLAHLSAQSTLRHSRRELRQAVGLARGGRPAGVQAYGYAQWSRDRGTITSSLARAGSEGSGCSQSVALGPVGALGLAVRGDRVRVTYGDPGSVPSDPLRTRCPGPSGNDVAGSGALASDTLPLRAFGRPRLTLHLSTGRRFRSDGYGGTTDPDVTVVLRRTKVRQYVQSFDVPNGFPKPLTAR